MAAKRVLFVEDHPAAQRAFKQAVRRWNEEHAATGRSFEVTLHETYTDAKAALEFCWFDCALFDLHLPTGAGQDDAEHDTKGSQLAEISLTENGIPVAIISALPEDTDEHLDKFPMLKVFGKSERYVYRKAISWLGDQWQMMEAVSATRRKIRMTGAEVFVERIWPRFENWERISGVAAEELTNIVTRQYVSHIAELMGADKEGNSKWHPFESYVKPAFQPEPHTGDIFLIEGELWVVLTPQCDMAQGKVDSVVLAHCDRSEIEGWVSNISKLRDPQDEAQKKKAGDFFRRYVNQGVDPACHFLPPLLDDNNPLMVRFRSLQTRDIRDLRAQLSNRVASVSAPFLSNLTQRFGAYMSRTGQPDINVDHLV